MSYWKPAGKNTRTIDSFTLSSNHTSVAGGGSAEFYEFEYGVVLDIILDDQHPIFTSPKSDHPKIDVNRWPADIANQLPLPSDPDYTWIGRVLVRPLISQRLTNKDELLWAYPLESNISEYPLINETVALVSLGEKLYYTKKLNYHNWPNNNLDFAIENASSGKPNNVLYSDVPLTGKYVSETNTQGSFGYKGFAGQYFCANNHIRTLKRYEGDLLFESRHGQSIHFTAYDGNRENDIGKYSDYTNGGNPMILIRNRQRLILNEGQVLTLRSSPNPAKIIGTKQEKNVGGYIGEDINHDGSSIHITSGLTVSGFVTTCYKKMYGMGEEVPSFQGGTTFTYPKLDGDQIVIQSDRLILSSRYAETFHYSKKRYAIVTDSEYTVDAHEQIVFTTHAKTVLNSPAIYLGQVDQTSEPALLGQTTVNWLHNLCDWLIAHIHDYKHSHVDAQEESPSVTQTTIDKQIKDLEIMRDNLQVLMSRRVFLTGGGQAPGRDGAYLG